MSICLGSAVFQSCLAMSLGRGPTCHIVGAMQDAFTWCPAKIHTDRKLGTWAICSRSCVVFLSFLCCARDQTHFLAHARRALYHWAMSPAPILIPAPLGCNAASPPKGKCKEHSLCLDWLTRGHSPHLCCCHRREIMEQSAVNSFPSKDSELEPSGQDHEVKS